MKTALLLGASRGIGFELARQYLTDGWRVIATARDEKGILALQNIGAQSIQLDVTKTASISTLSWQLDGEKIDTAIYVAGMMDRQSAGEVPTQAQFDQIMHTNVLGAMQAIPQILPMLQANGSAQATLACISSVMGSMTKSESGNCALYRISKAALNMVVRTLQAEVTTVNIVAIHPGWVQTEMGGPAAPLTPQQSASDIRKTLANIQPHQKGHLLNHDGTVLPW
jgi:NAD(P)-dependent dehydrogenase (short-subunit alcohol dehydrogenase family)